MRETFIKRYLAERTSKAVIRRKEPSEKAESCRIVVGKITVERAIKTETDTRTE